MLEDVMTMDRNDLGHTLVRFYLAHGYVIPLLDALTVREVHLTSECSLFHAINLCVCMSIQIHARTHTRTHMVHLPFSFFPPSLIFI